MKLNKLAYFGMVTGLACLSMEVVDRLKNPMGNIKVVYEGQEFPGKRVLREVDGLGVNVDNSVVQFADISEGEGLNDLEYLARMGEFEEAWAYSDGNWREVGISDIGPNVSSLGLMESWKLKNLKPRVIRIKSNPSKYAISIHTSDLMEFAKNNDEFTCYHIHLDSAIEELDDLGGNTDPTRVSLPYLYSAISTYHQMFARNIDSKVTFKIVSSKGITEYGLNPDLIDRIRLGEDVDIEKDSDYFEKFREF